MENYLELAESDGGFCVACGERAYGIEPDTTGCPCEHCGESAVFGAEELVIRGDLSIGKGENGDEP